MSKYLVKCKTCKIILSNKLNKLLTAEFNSLFDNTPKKDYIPEGNFFIKEETLNGVVRKNIITNLKDVKNTILHYDKSKVSGCCGLNGLDINTLCNKKHEVGIESSDCFIPHYFSFDSEKVYLYKINTIFEELILIFEDKILQNLVGKNYNIKDDFYVRNEDYLFLANKLNNNVFKDLKNLIDNELEYDAFLLIIDTLYMNQIRISSSIFNLINENAKFLNINIDEFKMLNDLVYKE